MHIYVKGSYANSTNVRLDSDVDICVEWKETFAVDTLGDARNATPAQLGYVPAEAALDPAEYRESVLSAMVAAFGSDAVDATGNKVIRVEAGSNTLDADVIPCHELRRYDSVGASPHVGSRIYPANGGHVDNFPQQHYENGVAKNTRTYKRFKSIVRCMKRLENEMIDSKTILEPVPGYLVECLVWSAPDSCFVHASILDDVRAVFRSLWEPLSTDAGCQNWVEINELKYLFWAGRGWTRAQAFEFVDKAWDTVGVS